jgi:hypothetical protein
VIRPSAEENQRSSIQAKRRNSITDALFKLGLDRMDGLAKLVEHDPLIRAYACEVFVNCSRFSFPRRHKDSKGSFPCVSSLQFADVDLLHLHHRIHHSSGLFRVFVVQHLNQHSGRDLPGQTELVSEPAALGFLAAVRGEFLPEIIHFVLSLAVHDEGH